MTRFDIRIVLATALFMTIVACARNEQAPSAAAESAADAALAAPAPAPTPPALERAGAGARDQVQTEGVDAGQQLASSANAATDPQRRFVRTAQATFHVQDVYASTLAIEDAVAAEGGFVAKNAIATQTLRVIERPVGDGKRLRLSEVVPEGTLMVRVPSERTQAFLRAIAKQMQFLDARNFEANDVQFELLRRQLGYRRAQELQQDIRIAGAQPGKTGEKIDAVQAREQMLAARDEAEVARRELEDRIAFSTLTLTLSQPAQVREQLVPDTEAILRERGPGFFSELGEALRAGWRGLLAALVLAAHLWPLWLVLAALVLGWRALRRRRGTVAATPTQEPPVAS